MNDALRTQYCTDGKHRLCRGRALNPAATGPENRWVDCDCPCGHPIIPQTGKRRKTPK